jgi:hypothetical protein
MDVSTHNTKADDGEPLSMCMPGFIILVLVVAWEINTAIVGLHCATNRKIAGSIPDDVIGIFH